MDPAPAVRATEQHTVGFHRSDADLVDDVADFLTPALTGDRAGAVVLVMPPHRAQLERTLAERGHDTAAARRAGRLLVLDADTVLEAVCVDGVLEPDRFRDLVTGWLDRATDGGRAGLVYGELVSRLWEEGNLTATLAVEDLWNEVLTGYADVRLFCGYPLRDFDGSGGTAAFEQVLDRHDAVAPSDGEGVAVVDRQQQLRTIARLQQQASADRSTAVRLRARQDQLEGDLDRLRRLDTIRNEFVAMVVHDIRSPSALVLASLQLLREQWRALDPDVVDDLLGKAIDSTDRIERLSADLLTVARIESGTFTFQLEPVDLAAVVDRVVGELRDVTGRTIEVHHVDDLPMAFADEDRQVQILSNLLTNAIKYSGEHSTVEVRLDEGGSLLLVGVRDEGIGMSPEDQRALFQPFSRLDGDRRRIRGTGLGLYIARALVEGQGGTIWVDSAEGRGSTFTYTVPVAAD